MCGKHSYIHSSAASIAIRTPSSSNTCVLSPVCLVVDFWGDFFVARIDFFILCVLSYFEWKIRPLMLVRRIALSIGPSCKHSRSRELTLPCGELSVFTRTRIAGLPDSANGCEPAKSENYVACSRFEHRSGGTAGAITVTPLTSRRALTH